MPVMPRTVEVGGSIAYDPRRDEVVRSVPTSTGLEYSMDVQLLDLTADTLRASATTADPRDVADYLGLPETSRIDDVRARAQEIVAGVEGRYDQALTLQSFFRSTQNFTYTTEVDPARSDDAVWDFLGSGTGYCVQFATAMTVMARALDIPARLAVGYLPGETNDVGEYVVTGRQTPTRGRSCTSPTPGGSASSRRRPCSRGPRRAGPTRSSRPSSRCRATPSRRRPCRSRPCPRPPPSRRAAPRRSPRTRAAGSCRSPPAPSSCCSRPPPTSCGAGSWCPRSCGPRRPGRTCVVGLPGPASSGPTPTPRGRRSPSSPSRSRRGAASPWTRRPGSALTDLARAVEDHRYAVAPRVWEHTELEQRVATVLREARRATSTGHARTADAGWRARAPPPVVADVRSGPAPSPPGCSGGGLRSPRRPEPCLATPDRRPRTPRPGRSDGRLRGAGRERVRVVRGGSATLVAPAVPALLEAGHEARRGAAASSRHGCAAPPTRRCGPHPRGPTPAVRRRRTPPRRTSAGSR